MHYLCLPGGACPVSGNPITAVLTVAYTSRGLSLEVVSLRTVVLALWHAPPPGAESVEGYVAHLRDVLAAVVPGLRVGLFALVRPGPQLLVVRA